MVRPSERVLASRARATTPRRSSVPPSSGSDTSSGKARGHPAIGGQALTLLARASSSLLKRSAPRYRKGRPPVRVSALSVVPVNGRNPITFAQRQQGCR